MKIVWTEPAVDDLRELHAYIARDSEMYASGFAERIMLAAERRLIDYPQLGRIVPEMNDENVRELIYRRYRIIYRVAAERVEMLSVIHGARDVTGLNRDPWEIE